jgi:heme-degrading monooxygenase HmoA
VTVIKINAITVPEDSGDELARRFAARAGAVDDQDGFEGFELLKPTDDRTTWLVITRWRDEAAFDAWVSSPSFAHGHRSAGGEEQPRAGDGGSDERGAGHGHGGPVGIHSELWSYEIAGGSSGRNA